jgi:uncharacterized sulfatase
MMGNFLLSFSALALTAIAVSAKPLPANVAVQRNSRAKPNIVFIMTDDQARWTIGAYGNKEVVTPNLDRLARDGMLLNNAFVPTPVCSASRATFLTGCYSTQTGVNDYLMTSEEQAGIGLPAVLPTWPAILHQAGYCTGLIGKWHLGDQPQFHPTRHGFDYFFGFLGGGTSPMNPRLEENGQERRIPGPVSDLLTDDAMRFVTAHQSRPFALVLHYREPHLPYGPMPDEDNAVYRGRRLTVPLHPGVDPQKTEETMRDYLTSVHAVDRNVGRLLAKLDELNLTGNTIVVFTSDHGYMIGQHGLYTKGNAWWLVQGLPFNTKRPNMYEDVIRIPFIVRWPGVIPAGSHTDDLFSSVDVFATMVGLAGVPLPGGLKQYGADYSPRLRGKTIPWRDAMFGQYDIVHGALDHLRMIRTERWKLVRHYLSTMQDELYDLQGDPGETRNLYRLRRPKDPDLVREATQARDALQARLYAWQREINDPLLTAMAAERDPARR